MSATSRRTAARWALAGLLSVLGTRASAEPAIAGPAIDLAPPAAMEADDHRPWGVGVSRAEQAAAFALYIAGNHEFAESRFAQALAKYKEAIRHWDHPAIRFNMAVCLINLDQPLEAMNDLARSLVFGDGPLGPDAYARGLTYRKLLDAQLAHLRIGCREPGTQITLDGKDRFTAPGTLDEIVLPGEHQVVATRAGFATVTRTLVLVAGRPTRAAVATITVGVMLLLIAMILFAPVGA